MGQPKRDELIGPMKDRNVGQIPAISAFSLTTIPLSRIMLTASLMQSKIR